MTAFTHLFDNTVAVAFVAISVLLLTAFIGA
jgi:hypothetical protein